MFVYVPCMNGEQMGLEKLTMILETLLRVKEVGGERPRRAFIY